MKVKINLVPFVFTIVFSMFFVSLKSYASEHTITFNGTGESNTVDSVIVQNLTQGTMVTVPAGNVLNLSDVPNSIDQLTENKHAILVFPNPVQEESTVSFLAEQAGSTQINVFGIDGKKIVGISKYLSAGENSFRLSLPKGAYAIRIAGNGYSYSAKVISQANTESKPEIDFIGNDVTDASVPQKNRSYVPQTVTITTMLYAEGDRLLYKGLSGNYCTIVTDVPTQSKTIVFTFVDCTDIDGNHYPVVQIGTQVWMLENLKTTRYRNGEAIGTTTPVTKSISSESAPKYQWAYNGDEYNASKYGRLYTWYVVKDSRNIAPFGWHVASDAEWTTLENYLIANGYNYDGTTTDNKIAKSLANTTDWYSYSSTGAIGNDLTKNNSSGFTALPGGCRVDGGAFGDVGYGGYWWSSTEGVTTHAWGRPLYYGSYGLYRYFTTKSYGFSVRCVRDSSATIVIPTLSTTTASSITTTSATSGGDITDDGGAVVSARGVCWNTTGSPTITDNITNDGTGAGSFVSNITDLTANTLYYVRAYATNSLGTSYGNEVSFTTLQGTEETVTDIDGNVYHTIKIGTQTWMVENLKTTRYRDGEAIGTTTPATKDISSESSPKYQWAYNGDESNASKYGRLYTWYAVNDSRNIAPAGWHVASDAEWATLENYLIANGYNYDGSTTSGNKIAKSLAATTDWYSGSGTGTIGNDLTKNNSSGFTALPGGYRLNGGSFGNVGSYGYWWSSTEDITTLAWARYLYYGTSHLGRGNHLKSYGFSVRCVRDY